MKFINTCRKYGAKLAVVTAAPLALAAHANTTLPDTAKNALEAAKADGMEAGWIVVGRFSPRFFVFSIVKRVMK
ncbi:major capsid protein [Neisseria meningitidis]|uniref:major capsid protein n=1 Tax=Neisseria meningitidis TaxID=487 RepID=UPI00046DBB90